MVEMVVKEADPQGRVSIPIEWRRGWKSRRLILIRRGSRIELVPMEATAPSDLFDSIKIPESVDFTDIHSIRKALAESREP